jgi:hypothetical protein
VEEQLSLVLHVLLSREILFFREDFQLLFAPFVPSCGQSCVWLRLRRVVFFEVHSSVVEHVSCVTQVFSPHLFTPVQMLVPEQVLTSQVLLGSQRFEGVQV